MNRYPEYVLTYMRRRFGLNDQDHSMDEAFAQMEPWRVFHHVLAWNGLSDEWDVQIKTWIKDVYGIDIDANYRRN